MSMFLFLMVTLVSSFFAVQPVFAETTVAVSSNGSESHTSVNVTSNTGNNTICQNGSCTTSSNGTSTSTVCINGNCHTTNGDTNYQSDNGDTNIHIQSNTAVNATVSSTVTPGVTASDHQATQDAMPQHTTPFQLGVWLQQQFAALKKFFSFSFFFGK